MTDEQLLIRYRDTGDQDSFTELVGRLQAELVAFLRTKVGSDAEDVAQKTWMRVCRHLTKFKEGCRLRPWLYTIAGRLAIDSLRAARSTDPIHQNIPELQPGDHRDLLAAVDSLPDKLCAVIVAVFIRGCRYDEAGRELGISTGTVKSRVANALARLRRKPCLM